MDEQYNCDHCTAQCTFEAMQMCQSGDDCPVIVLLASGVIVDRRPTDFDPKFPSHFTYAQPDAAGDAAYDSVKAKLDRCRQSDAEVKS